MVTVADIAARFNRGDEIHWTSSPHKYRKNHKGVGKYEGTTSDKVLVTYLVSAKYDQWKTIHIDPSRVILGDLQSVPLSDGG